MIEIQPGTEAKDLIPGDPEQIERLAARFAKFATNAGEASERLSRLEGTAWQSQAGELFRGAVGEVPTQLTRAGTAFTGAARALLTYAGVLREAQRTATRAVRLVESSTPESAPDDRATASALVEAARADVADAGTTAGAQLSELTSTAPGGGAQVSFSGGMPVLQDGDVTVQAVADHQLVDPDQFVAPLDMTTDIRYGGEHDVSFSNLSAQGWGEWAGQDAERGIGLIEPAALAALGVGVAAVLIGRRRRERTALAVAGLSESDLRRRASSFGHTSRDGVVALARSGGGAPRSAATWRTRLASAPGAGGTVHAWVGPEADPRSRASDAGAVQLSGAGSHGQGVVVHTGPPAVTPAGSGMRR